MGESEHLPEELIRDNLYNWLGYGNLNGEYWFIGREEFDSISKCRKLEGLRDYYEVRREFGPAEDFVEVWEQSYGRSVDAGTSTVTTRHFQAAFLLAFNGTSPRGRNSETGKSKTASFVFSEKRFGRSDGNHFSGEIFPLRYHPKRRETFDPYRGVWPTPQRYEEEVLPKRIDLYVDQLRQNQNVKAIISYAESDEFVNPLKNRVDHDDLGTRAANKSNHFELSKCYLNREREVLLIDSPFLGQGHVGYTEIQKLGEGVGQFVS